MFIRFVELLISLWFIGKFVKKKEIRSLFIASILLVFQLRDWPIYCHHDTIFILLGIVGVLFLAAEWRFNKKIQSIYVYVIVFAGIACFYAIEHFMFSNALR